MLPSTGLFREANCPFLESGLCERPHCHYRHAKRDSAPRLLRRLVSEAVESALRSSPTTLQQKAVLTYNPTPISELNEAPARRHIPVPAPVPYTPSGPTRAPARIVSSPSVSASAPDSSYVPTAIADLTYEPSAEPKAPSSKADEGPAYTPTPLSRPPPPLDRDEDEPPAKKEKRDESPVALEGLELEFEMLDKILDEERPVLRSKPKSDRSERSKTSSKEKAKSESSRSRRDKKSSHRDRRESKSSKDKTDRSGRTRDEPPKKEKKKETQVELNFSVRDGHMEIFSSESDPEAIDEECKKIFDEYVPTSKKIQEAAPVKPDASEDERSTSGKRRVARANDRAPERPAPAPRLPDHKSKAAQLMAERYCKVKKFHEARSKTEPAEKPSVLRSGAGAPSSSSVPSLTSSKVRIAHVPYAASLLNAKKAIPKPTEPPKVTAVQTIPKGVARLAHVPNEKFCDRPGVLEPLTSKVPISIRTRYLNMMIDESLKIYLEVEDAYARALQEELCTSKKCKAIPIYKNSAMLAVSRLRKELQESNGVKKDNKIESKIGENVSWSIENKYKNDNQFGQEFKGVKFYENVERWKLSEKELQDNGFPRPHPDAREKGKAKIYTKNTRQRPPKGNLRPCRRCHKEYMVDKKGFAVVTEECIYHPNNKYRFRGEVKYQCCGQDGSSDGCLSALCHVYEYIDHDNLRGYVTTLPKDEDSEDRGVYALDCEMCYTTNGLDLTRVTVINSSCKVVYETLVKPIFPIIDYNTRYSGLTEENMNDCKTTLLEVQATFLHMFSDKTILIGHSLESDFKALKLIHNTVVDTSVLFPHKMGPPYKRALRNLSSEYLKKIIQNSDGHDSAEDATVCMELILWKLKEELKIR